MLVSLSGVQHRYGATVALADCRLDIEPGEVHALVGENGSGKSTVVKLLSGIMRPTAGSVQVDGAPVTLRSPAHAQHHGIVTVFQETLVADELTSLDNVFAGTDGLFRRRRSVAAQRTAAADALTRLGADPALLDLTPDHLSLAERQILTLARALVRPWRLLILDEATSALDLATRDRLFALVNEQTTDGRSVLFVSHRMDELQLIIDRATVQRSGVTVGTVTREEATPAKLLAMMSGRAEQSAPARSGPPRTGGDDFVLLRDLTLEPGAEPFDLTLHRGRILGVAGLDGQGGSALVETVAGLRKPHGGTVGTADGVAITSHRSAFAAGVAYVPGKRQEEGLFPTLDVADNLAMAILPRLARRGFFRRSQVLATVREHLDGLGVHPSDPRYPITGLSGGNAQKVLVGRWLAAEPDLLVLNDPLRGVDLGTKVEFYALLRRLTDEGMTVLMLSTELEELLAVCDRIAVCADHRVATVLDGDAMTHDAALAAMFGQEVP
ncbi:sugar ABC transporter ATP-binding protein [Cryptosporangium arvum]|uniref:ABC-type sugar transport system, ATPase component n=1 Tax=Cryptosporangium arvum DSM 44712 TaxID=927661 RepID=A0A010Z583_9ACTN|nr:sugar ABC transporter ATP-binding protein [Cryptosporangium arvum]EXG82508.1 ABC-type sugar transport system, ATPase component [Cryptosporangium arvum DSM 44712]